MAAISAYIKFDGLDATTELRVDQKLVDALQVVFPYWPHEVIVGNSDNKFASITLTDGVYVLSSPFMDKPKRYRDPANTLCSLIVELAWARLREDTHLLCLHGAAIEFAGRLVIFPSTRRAGKSTLTVALAAAGKKVFTDDFLPLSVANDRRLLGVSSGISPRLRLPVPDQIGPRAQIYIANRSSVSNKQYKYVAPTNGELAKFGQTAPIGSLVFLERSEDAELSIEPRSKSDALESLIKQNFSRAMNSAGILRLLAFVTDTTPAYRLKYNETEAAIELLESKFNTWPTSLPKVGKDLDASLFETVIETTFEAGNLDVSQGQFIHATGVTEVARDGKRFLTGREGKSIHYLNDGATTIWRLLEEPTSIDEAIEMLCALFPDHPPDAIRSDVVSTYSEFAKNGMLQRVQGNCQTPETEAKLSV